jgi:hypothetical protein
MALHPKLPPTKWAMTRTFASGMSSSADTVACVAVMPWVES